MFAGWMFAVGCCSQHPQLLDVTSPTSGCPIEPCPLAVPWWSCLLSSFLSWAELWTGVCSLLECVPASTVAASQCYRIEKQYCTMRKRQNTCPCFLCLPPCFGGWSRMWGLTLLCHPPEYYTAKSCWEAAAKRWLPLQESQPGSWEVVWENLKYSITLILILHHNCSALLPYLMVKFWDYSPVPQVMFPLLSEHTGSESAAFLGTAALGVSPVGMGTGRELGLPQPSQHLEMESLAAGRTVVLLLQAEILSSLIASCCIYFLEFVK